MNEPHDLKEQWYRSRPSDWNHRVDRRGLVEPAQAAWGGEARLDSQWARLRPGEAIGIPVWQTADWADQGAWLAMFGREALLEVERVGGQRVRPLPGHPVELFGQDRIRFHPATEEHEVELILARPAPKGLGPPRRRLSARIFAPVRRGESDGGQVDWSLQPTLSFLSQPRVIQPLTPATDLEIAREPSFQACSIPIALQVGGPLLQRFVEALPESWRLPDADVRVGVARNELSPGWNPCAVGFHLDGTSRIHQRSDGHPDLVHPGQTVEQMIVCFGEGAPTRFLRGPVDLPEPPLGDLAPTTGAKWGQLLEAAVAEGQMEEWLAPPNTLVAFGHGDFHTGSTSREPGWRCFVKAMRYRREPMPERATMRMHDTVTWPIDAAHFPADPCGVFPDDVP